MARHHISYDDDTERVIKQQVEAGIAESRSEWFRHAAHAYLLLQDVAAEAVVAAALDDGDLSVEEAAAFIEDVESTRANLRL